jgi:superfamily II DNA helicase RecQ
LNQLHLVTDDKAVRKTAREQLGKLKRNASTKAACFMACQSGFTVEGHVRARTQADLEFVDREGKTPARDEPSGIPKDVPHPALYARLRDWRRDMAEALDKEPHEILPTRSLEQIVRSPPQSRKALKEIEGIGASRLKRFGPALLALIGEFAGKVR